MCVEGGARTVTFLGASIGSGRDSLPGKDLEGKTKRGGGGRHDRPAVPLLLLPRAFAHHQRRGSTQEARCFT